MVESRRLPADENLWLHSLQKNLQDRRYDAIVELTAQRKASLPSGAYLAALALANPRLFVEVGTMATKTRKKAKTFEEIFTEAGIIPEWINRGRVEGKAEGRVEGEVKGKTEVARNLLTMQMPIEMIAQAVQMPIEEIHALAAG